MINTKFSAKSFDFIALFLSRYLLVLNESTLNQNSLIINSLIVNVKC